ncbi:TetR/AcrR family transcriptional regulator [Amycolatopsis jiangsuensis]|uniref:AcrR family transcriptional regulator n=1 Tax=Amycolatopsis jiangsuensis TaxID=1181879 RepID=A0A840J0R1_9PSEU|nr:TetR/AcrR family transcriptional regulator [Amycolatopsis jiangsuensis]MBB4687087.1 AcrR family transcriptional regulator [Amycolatopsis jiangsuensis]
MSLREQKKLETRRTISHVATRLFIDRGFDQVTIADVAQAARVAKMTVTNHFSRKEDLVFDIRTDFVDWPTNLVRAAPSSPAVVAVRDGFLTALGERSAMLGFAELPFIRMIRQSETLSSALTEMHLERERVLVAALLDRKPEPEMLSRTAGAHLTSVLRLLFEDVWDWTWADVPPEELVSRVRKSAGLAFAQLEPAIGTL